MFALIIGLIAIVLTVVLVLAGIYYGGSAFDTSGAKAQAATYQTQGDQVAGAIMIYEEQHAGSLPASMNDLVPEYLTTLPIPPGQTATAWTISGNYVVSSGGISKKSCEQADTAVGLSAIPACSSATPQTPCCSE